MPHIVAFSTTSGIAVLMVYLRWRGTLRETKLAPAVLTSEAFLVNGVVYYFSLSFSRHVRVFDLKTDKVSGAAK
jgi:hypothetical protein